MQANIMSRRSLTVTAHVIFIIILCILPEVLFRMSWTGAGHSFGWGVYAKSGVMIAVFYVNYFVLVPRYLVRRHSWWRFLVLNLLLIVAMSVLMYMIGRWGAPEHGHHGRRHHRDEWQMMVRSASFMLRDAGMLLLTASLAVALRLPAKLHELEQRQQQLVAAQRESELDGLRSQLNPHFLFNTLNSIYALIAIEPGRAQEAVHQLSGMLRYVVYENPERVDLRLEVDFLTNYIELMRLRMPDRPVVFTARISADAPQVPPLLFVTPVENAFKYGAGAPPSRSIEITLTATAEQVSCVTVNGFSADARSDRGAGGIGLANLRRRLELIYGDRATLTAGARGDTFRTTLTIDASCPSSNA